MVMGDSATGAAQPEHPPPQAEPDLAGAAESPWHAALDGRPGHQRRARYTSAPAEIRPVISSCQGSVCSISVDSGTQVADHWRATRYTIHEAP
jgi:hypothetical protein